MRFVHADRDVIAHLEGIRTNCDLLPQALCPDATPPPTNAKTTSTTTAATAATTAPIHHSGSNRAW